MCKTLLFVDDEKQILKSIRRLFLETDYTIYTAESGEEALKILNDTKVDLIVADMRMPVMDGFKLLQKVKQMYPSTIRLMLSGYAEEKLIIGALQNNLASLYLFKPWESTSLLGTIKKALQVGEILYSEEIQEILENIGGELLYSFDAYERCRDIKELLCRMEEKGMNESFILDAVNASFFEVHFKSLKDALDNLGEFNIRNVILAEELHDILGKINSGVDSGLMRQYTYTCSKIMDLIYKRLLKKEMDDMNRSAGLVHDIGEYIYQKDSAVSHGYEKKKGSRHQEIGGYILNKCGFTYPVVEAALFHHNPMDSRLINKEIAAVAHIAGNYAGKITEICRGKEIDKNVFEYLGISEKSCDRLIAENIRNI